jgi:hypothetical protein
MLPGELAEEGIGMKKGAFQSPPLSRIWRKKASSSSQTYSWKGKKL